MKARSKELVITLIAVVVLSALLVAAHTFDPLSLMRAIHGE